jgi:hypothetical protein
MGRLAALLIFSTIGFSIGFFAYVASPTVYNWFSESLPNVVLTQLFIGAITSGAAGAGASIALIYRWSRRP